MQVYFSVCNLNLHSQSALSVCTGEMLPGLDDIVAIKKPDQNKYSKNNIEVGDVHQPLQKTHLLLGRPEPVLRFSLEPV